ncbi:hypothetical protein KUTeg_008326 [Tegillarca granosa]|uniref:ATP-dependent RNA helicase DHX8 n=1 Tax=Tegillarca granosa TaxID=220873 RepID=A0ABQ9FBY9_TEGGR|nr:hypothetical protein KUTeg_008326 [Tegillarca granosa]
MSAIVTINIRPDIMDELQKLEHLSLVSKVCTELDNHLGLNDKDLAEFVINLAEKNDTFDKFKKVLEENGAEFADSLIANLLRLIQKMKPKPKAKDVDVNKENKTVKDDRELKKKLFPGLALPNDPTVRYMLKDEEEDDIVKKKEDKEVASGMMDELEALLNKPLTETKVEKDRDRKRKRRSRSRERDSEKQNKEKERDRKK